MLTNKLLVKKNHTLIIWQFLPEETKLYLIPDELITEEHAKLIKEANGKLINASDDCDGLNFLNAAFSQDTLPSDVPFAKEALLYEEFETNPDRIANVLISSVCVTGIVL